MEQQKSLAQRMLERWRAKRQHQMVTVKTPTQPQRRRTQNEGR